MMSVKLIRRKTMIPARCRAVVLAFGALAWGSTEAPGRSAGGKTLLKAVRSAGIACTVALFLMLPHGAHAGSAAKIEAPKRRRYRCMSAWFGDAEPGREGRTMSCGSSPTGYSPRKRGRLSLTGHAAFLMVLS